MTEIALVAGSPISHRSMGGGDRILIEIAKHWQRKGWELTLLGPPEARSVCCQIGGLVSDFVQTSNFPVEKLGTTWTYLLRIIHSVFYPPKTDRRFDVIYTASEALPDIALSLRLKISRPKVLWVVGFYLRSRNPFRGEILLNFNSLNQFLQQQVSLFLMKLFKVDVVFVAGRPDEAYLRSLSFNKVIKIGGGVDLGVVDSVPDQEMIYDACFVGRISKQKGIDDLLEVWRLVCQSKEKSRLAINVWGHLGEFEKLKIRIDRWGLSNNVQLFGFLNAPERFRVIRSSKLTLFPSYYESFGLVLLESLSCGVPVVAYDLKVLRDNFDQGVIYVGLGDQKTMAEETLKLLEDENRRRFLSEAALSLSRNFSWEKVGQLTYENINVLLEGQN